VPPQLFWVGGLIRNIERLNLLYSSTFVLLYLSKVLKGEEKEKPAKIAGKISDRSLKNLPK